MTTNPMTDRELEEEYYVHRKGTITGNAPAFWAIGGNGYTSYVQGAERFTKRDAEALLNSDPKKWAIYRCKDIDARLHLVFDIQDTKRLGTNEPCGWHFGYARAALSTEAHGREELQRIFERIWTNHCEERGESYDFRKENGEYIDWRTYDLFQLFKAARTGKDE